MKFMKLGSKLDALQADGNSIRLVPLVIISQPHTFYYVCIFHSVYVHFILICGFLLYILLEMNSIILFEDKSS